MAETTVGSPDIGLYPEEVMCYRSEHRWDFLSYCSLIRHRPFHGPTRAIVLVL